MQRPTYPPNRKAPMPLRIRSILAAHDGTDGASALVRTAASLAALAEAEIHILHAVEPLRLVAGAAAIAGMEAERREARASLRRWILEGIEPSVPVTSCEIIEDAAHPAILERAAQVDADLILIGPHRPRAVGDRVLGSTADRVVRTSEIPCLIVHAALSLPLRRILVATDLSPAARNALEVGMTWSALLRMPMLRGGGTELTVLHVARDAESARRAKMALDDEVAGATERTGIGSMLAVRAAVQQAPDAGEALLEAAGGMDADLLVIGTHGRGALARALIGSVSSWIARTATIPVLLVPPPREDR
jgi:nucleotide-binding universal stress UspA family protein